MKLVRITLKLKYILRHPIKSFRIRKLIPDFEQFLEEEAENIIKDLDISLEK